MSRPTTIQPQRNNPLKFSASVDEAMTNLLFRQSGEYPAAPSTSVRETFGDIKQHQQSCCPRIRTAVADYIGRLDPEELESKLSNGKRGIMNAANKLRYWDLYKDLYQVVANAPAGAISAAIPGRAHARVRDRRLARGAVPAAKNPNAKLA